MTDPKEVTGGRKKGCTKTESATAQDWGWKLERAPEMEQF